MIKRCIMISPQFQNMNLIDDLRKKYDPLFEHVKPHITLVFPFDSEIEETELKQDLTARLYEIKPFPIKLQGITHSNKNGYFLFLHVQKGKENLVKMQQRLYSGILKPYFPEWLRKVAFYPHLTVGKFENEADYKQAIEETKDFQYSFETIVNSISVEIIDVNEDSIIELNVPLGEYGD